MFVNYIIWCSTMCEWRCEEESGEWVLCNGCEYRVEKENENSIQKTDFSSYLFWEIYIIWFHIFRINTVNSKFSGENIGKFMKFTYFIKENSPFTQDVLIALRDSFFLSFGISCDIPRGLLIELENCKVIGFAGFVQIHESSTFHSILMGMRTE